MRYQLVIEEAGLDCSFTYRVFLYYLGDGGERTHISDTYRDTQWGAKRWARQTAKAHKARRDREPFRLEWEFEV